MNDENTAILLPTDRETWDEIWAAPLPDYTDKSHMTDLPFYESWDKPWVVEPTDDYGEACRKGTEYAAHFAMYIHHHRSISSLQRIASAVDLTDKRRSGYAVGFFSFIEEIITDPYFWVPHYKRHLWRYKQYELQEEAKKRHRNSRQFIEDISERGNTLARMQRQGGAS